MVNEVDPIQEGLAVWRTVFANASNTSAYLTPAWTAAWLAEFASRLHPRQLVVSEASRGAAPLGTCLLTIRSDWRTGIPLRRAYLNTDGEPVADRAVIEHNAILAVTGHEEAVYAAVARHITHSPIDELVFSGANTLEIARLRRALPDWSLDVEWKDSPFVDLSRLREEGGDPLRSLSRNSREQLRRSIRQFERLGLLRLESVQDGAAEEAFNQLLDLHGRHWATRGEPGGFASPARRRFHANVIRSAGPSSNVHLLRIWCGEQLLGVLYNLVHGGRIAFYQSGFNYSIDPRFRPGLVGHHLATLHYLKAGYSEYDFLPSAPGDGRYKDSLSNAHRQLGTLLLRRPGWRTRYFNFLRRMKRITLPPISKPTDQTS